MLLIYRLSLKQVLYAHVQAVFLSPVKNLRLKNDNYRKSKIRNSFTTTNSSKLPSSRSTNGASESSKKVLTPFFLIRWIQCVLCATFQSNVHFYYNYVHLVTKRFVH